MTVPRVPFEELSTHTSGESSAAIRTRVIAARELRQDHERPILKPEQLAPDARRLLAAAVAKMSLSARGATRVTRVAQTIAYLAERTDVRSEDIAQALQYRPDSDLVGTPSRPAC